MATEHRADDPFEGFDGSAIRPRRIADEVVPFLRQLILSGQFAPGERLNEVKLAATLNISRPPVREALQALAGEGLVRTVAGRGTYVASFDPETVDHLAEVRQALECTAARLAAQRADAERVDELERLLVRTKVALGGSGQPYPRDLDFHEQILELSGNPKLVETARGVTMQLQLARARSGGTPERAQAAYAEHCRIYHALRTRDSDAAAAAMAAHLEAAHTHIRHLLRGPADDGRGPSAGGADPAMAKEIP